jgi:hypothetical protein
MQAHHYPVVGIFRNDTDAEMRLFLELVPQEVVLSPGHSVELLAKPSDGLLPLTIDLVSGGLQIHAFRDWDPDWHVRFKEKVIRVECPTLLNEHE